MAHFKAVLVCWFGSPLPYLVLGGQIFVNHLPSDIDMQQPEIVLLERQILELVSELKILEKPG